MKARAKKSLGQHFLRSEKALSDIVSAAKIVPGETVVEVGPGRGVLTEALLRAGARVVAVEKDRELTPELRSQFKTSAEGGRFLLIEGDALSGVVHKRIFHKSAVGKGPYKVVANIPYYITGALFRLFLEDLRPPSDIIFLVQKEVAETVVARGGKESILSLSVRYFGDPRIVARVPRGAFSPPPKVDSAILHIALRPDRPSKIDTARFFRVLHAGFSSRRKMLLGNLSKKLGIPAERLREIFSSVGIPEKARGEDVPIARWVALASAISP